MQELPEIKKLIGQTIKSLYVVIHNPNYQEPTNVADIAFGFILHQKPNQFFVLTTSLEDIWTPLLKTVPFPELIHNWGEFDAIMSRGKDDDEEDYLIDYEYFDVSDVKEFSDIVNSEILEIFKIGIIDTEEPFGVRIIFKNDHIMSFPSSDGNMIETKTFNVNNNLRHFEYLGEIITEKMIDNTPGFFQRLFS